MLRFSFGYSFSSFLFVAFSFMIFIVTGCGNEPQPTRSTKNISMMDDTVLNYNKHIVNKEDQEIEDFIARHQWKMERTPTGLRYMIYKKGHGEKAKEGKKAIISYETRLINGEVCYSSAKDGLKEILLGHSSSETGLEQGILLLKVGDRVKLIVPLHLAFGLLGDQDKIPPQSTLVYDIELIKLK
jgi:FKBP-type peptidyl-prolyl cis-trans isomerase FkpA